MKNKWLGVFCLLFSKLWGEESDFPAQVESPSYLGQFIHMLFTLIFVLALIFATVWLLKKITHSKTKFLNRSNRIKVLERRPLNPKASLYLIEVLGKGMVIGESPAGIHLLSEFSGDTAMEERLSQGEEEQPPSFWERFKR